MQSFALTASRWHKISERLSARASQASEEAKAAFTNTRVDGYAGEAQIEALSERSAEGLKALEAHRVAMNAVAAIRAAIGKANAANGVSEALAQRDVLNRRVKLLKELVGAQKPEMVAIEALRDYKPFSESAGRSMYRHEERGAISVRTLSRADEAALKKEIDTLEIQLYGLADSANDLNRGLITLQLDPQVAALAGLE